MGIISILRAVLGVSGSERDRPREGATPVTVRREADSSNERAVKGVEPAPTDDGGAAGADAAVEEDASGEPTGEPVDSIKGIGAAYADRLAAAGVHTVDDLAAADADALAADTDIGAGRLGNWIEQARARTRTE